MLVCLGHERQVTAVLAAKWRVAIGTGVVVACCTQCGIAYDYISVLGWLRC